MSKHVHTYRIVVICHRSGFKVLNPILSLQCLGPLVCHANLRDCPKQQKFAHSVSSAHHATEMRLRRGHPLWDCTEYRWSEARSLWASRKQGARARPRARVCNLDEFRGASKEAHPLRIQAESTAEAHAPVGGYVGSARRSCTVERPLGSRCLNLGATNTDGG